MKFGIRTPSLKRRIAARTSWKRVVRHNMGFKAPRGFGWFTNPKRAAYNRIYSRTTISADKLISAGAVGIFAAVGSIFTWLFSKNKQENINSPKGVILCPICSSAMVIRDGSRGKFYGCPRFPQCKGTRDLLIEDEHIQ